MEEKETWHFPSDPENSVKVQIMPEMFVAGFEMHAFLAVRLPCQMFHLGFVLHFLITEQLRR